MLCDPLQSLEKFSSPVFTRLPASSDPSVPSFGTRLAISPPVLQLHAATEAISPKKLPIGEEDASKGQPWGANPHRHQPSRMAGVKVCFGRCTQRPDDSASCLTAWRSPPRAGHSPPVSGPPAIREGHFQPANPHEHLHLLLPSCRRIQLRDPGPRNRTAFPAWPLPPRS